MNVNVKIKMTRNMPMPAYATDGAAAMDLRAALDEGEVITLAPGARALIPTGVHIAPETSDVVAILAGRSGLGVKYGVSLSNCIGVIDADYRGEICVGLINKGEADFKVERGDRIAQLMFMPVCHANLLAAETLDETDRGEGGFGSTGIK